VVDALDSLEAQSERDWEMIVVNDSGEELDLTPWPYATLVNTPGERGAGYARNRGIEVSRAPHFVCLDADDFLQAHALERLLIAASLYPEYWIYPDMLIYKGSGVLEHYRCDDFSTQELWRHGVAPVTCIYERGMWERVGGFSETSYREDWDFHLRLAKAGVCGIRLPEPLLTYRHGTGERRKDGSHRREIVTLHKTYNQQELEMACRGCSKRGRIRNMPTRPREEMQPPENWTTKEAEGWPILRYTGGNTSTLVFRGVTKRRYYAGNNQTHREVRVHPEDYQGLLRLRCFTPAGVEAGSRPMTAEPTPRAKKAPPRPKRDRRAKVEQPPAPPASPAPDLSEMRVAEIQGAGFEGLDLDTLLTQEEEGKNRVTVIRHLEKLKRQRGVTETR